MGVTNIWHVLNLTESPFFQSPLSPEEKAQYPIHLFVGREEEADYVLRGIGGAQHTRHAIQGPAGVGKTTLVQYIKSKATEDDYLAESEPIAVTSVSTADELRIRILLSVYDALLAHDRSLSDTAPMQDIRHLLDVDRQRVLNVSLGIAQLGSAGAGTSRQRHTGPGALAVQPERLLRSLSDLVMKIEGVRGVLIHLNNLENLTVALQQRAAQVIIDLRDAGLMYTGFHFLLVGTDEAIRTIVTDTEHLRSVFSNPGSLRPLEFVDLERLLAARYDYLALFDPQDVHPPVSRESLEAVYQVFRGNLRGTLQALDEAAKVLIGRGDDPTAPMGPEALKPVLTALYQRKLRTDLNSTQQTQIQAISKLGLDSVFAAKQMEKPFGLKYTATNNALQALQQKGYIEETESDLSRPRKGRPSRTFRLTGAGRIALGAFG